jgi:hypothetical protein
MSVFAALAVFRRNMIRKKGREKADFLRKFRLFSTTDGVVVVNEGKIGDGEISLP